MNMQQSLCSLLGVRCAAWPLDACRMIKPYLLETYGIPADGTALIFAVPYLICADVRDQTRNLSLYAVPRDYHLYIRELSGTLLPALRERFPAHRFALFSDHAPIDEVDAAARAGLGVIGENGLLITQEYGSFVFLAELVTDAGYESVTGRSRAELPTGAPPRCPGCGACRAACPGGCIGSDRSTCLSALTQKKSALTPEESEALRVHPQVWGCDTCQLVCPLNRAVLAGGHDTPLDFFRRARITHLTPDLLDGMSDEDFASRAYAWRGRAVIRRNLLLEQE